MPLHAGAPGRQGARAPGTVSLAFDADARRAVIEASEFTRFTPRTPDNLDLLDRQAASVRSVGYCAAFEERNIGVGSISAPVFNHTGELAGALGLGFPTQRVAPADADRLGPIVASAAAVASDRLGYARAR